MLYLKRNYIEYTEPDYTCAQKFVIGKMSYYYHDTTCFFPFNGLINDVRVYDHILSVKEIKEISKGLVLHYKLDSVYDTGVLNKYSGDTAEGKCSSSDFTMTKLENERGYNYKLSVTGNGSNHWDSIVFPHFSFTANKRYYWSCKIRINSCSNMSLYFRAARILNDWATNSIGIGKVTNEWKEIVLTRTIPATFSDRTGSEDISNPDLEFMSDNLKENGKVYYMDIDIKDVQVIESDAYMPFIDNTMVDNVVYDVSGYSNNGTRIGTNMIYNTDTPRYNSCIKIADNTSHIVTPVINMNGFADSYTISWWEKASGINMTMPWGFSNGNRLNVYHCNYLCCNTGDSDSNKFSPLIHIDSVIDNNWHHMVLTGDGSENKLYIDGKYMATAPTYRKLTGSQIYLSDWNSGSSYPWLNGSLSDFRIYSTVLSDEDIKKLYNTSAFVDNEGNVYSYNFDDSIDHLKVNNKGIFNHGNFYESANYMDMKTLILDTGEVFVRILHHNCQNGTVYFTRENVLDIQSEHLYSRLGLMENYRMPDGKFEFLATQSNDSNLYRWKQSSNPVISETLEGFETITHNNNGLCKNPYCAACAVSNKSSNWWCAIGSWTNLDNAIPGFGVKEVNEINLYVRVCPERFRSFSNYLTCNTINEI